MINSTNKTLLSLLRKIAIVAVCVGMFSCIPQKKMVLLQTKEINDSTYAKKFDGSNYADSIYRIQANDYLYINITSIEKEITQFFEPVTAVNYISGNNQALTGYVVDDEGYIEFPYLGKIHLQGQTLPEARRTIREASSVMVKRSRIEIRLINNTISIMGEVQKQGVYRIAKSKIDIYEAIALAQGFTTYAKRNKVKVVRTVNGERKVYLVDLHDGRLITKKMFYVVANDIIYVEPMRAKSLGISPTFSVSLITTLVSLVILAQSLSN